MRLFEVSDDIWDFSNIQQEYPSDKTSINQIPRTFKVVDSMGGWREGMINLDIGGGRDFQQDGQSVHKFSNALKNKGVINLVFDPFNRDFSHNMQVVERVKKEGADSVTVNNVLNVIPEESNRKTVIQQAFQALKPDCYAYFHIYEGNKTGEGAPSGQGRWQNNLKADHYVSEISSVFSNVNKKGQLIIAKK